MSTSGDIVALSLEKIECLFILIKVVIGFIVGIVYGYLMLTGALYLLLAIAILVAYCTCMIFLVPQLKLIRPLKLYLWDGTFSYIIGVVLMWTVVYNLQNPLVP